MFLVLTGVIYDADGHLSQGRHLENGHDDDHLPGRMEPGREWGCAFTKFWSTGWAYEQRPGRGW